MEEYDELTKKILMFCSAENRDIATIAYKFSIKDPKRAKFVLEGMTGLGLLAKTKLWENVGYTKQGLEKKKSRDAFRTTEEGLKIIRG